MGERADKPRGGFLSRTDRPLVLYLIQQHDYSGAELMHVPVMRQDAQPLLACPPGSRTEDLGRRNGIPTAALPFRPLRLSGGPLETLRSVLRGAQTVRDLRRLLQRHPERGVIYCTSLRPGMIAALAKWGLDRRAVWFVESWLPAGPLAWVIRALALIGCDRAVATSHAAGRRYVGGLRTLGRRTAVAYPATELARFDSAGVRPGAPRAAIIGEVSETKSTDLALDVAALVARERPDFELDVIGRAQFRASDFEYERRLRQRVRDDPVLCDRVRFTGYAEDVASVVRRAGLLLHCRPDEPFGIVLVEAMAVGLPVVAPRSAGPAEIVEEGDTGFLYPPGDSQTAADCVMLLLTDRGLAERMGRKGRESAERRFASGSYIRTIEELLEQLC